MTQKLWPFDLPYVPPVFTRGNLGQEHRQYAKHVYADFLSYDVGNAKKIIEETSFEEWDNEGKKRAMDLFHAAATRVPAYKDFLQKQGIQHEDVKSWNDFVKIPPIDKDNYLKNYSVQDLSWDGELHTSQIISVSSGSTGSPFFWPRGLISEIETTYQFEFMLQELFRTDVKSTLFVNAFAMGMYVGGPITLNSVLRIAHKGHKITIVTPGYSIEEIRRIIRELGPRYEQIILASYPPFAKDIIDDGINSGIDWKNLSVKFWLAGEGYSEGWRDYIAEMAGSDSVHDIMNVYGTADAAMLGHETPFSVVVRKAFNESSEIRSKVFGEDRLPSLLQYYPTLRYFETLDNNELIFTGSTGIPLIRYNIHDRGGILTPAQINSFMNGQGTTINQELTAYGAQTPPLQLPLVYVFGRSDFTTVFYGANIYPENIKIALEDEAIRNYVSGKFTMITEDDKFHNQRLVLHIECGKGEKKSRSIQKLLEAHLVTKLQEINSEYGVVYRDRGRKARPVIVLYDNGEGEYFGGKKVKQSWTLRFKKGG